MLTDMMCRCGPPAGGFKWGGVQLAASSHLFMQHSPHLAISHHNTFAHKHTYMFKCIEVYTHMSTHFYSYTRNICVGLHTSMYVRTHPHTDMSPVLTIKARLDTPQITHTHIYLCTRWISSQPIACIKPTYSMYLHNCRIAPLILTINWQEFIDC